MYAELAEFAARRLLLWLAIVLIVSMCIGGIVGATIVRYVRQPSKPATFTEWMIEHEPTCPQCGGPTDNGPPAMCEEAFEALKDFARKGKL